MIVADLQRLCGFGFDLGFSLGFGLLFRALRRYVLNAIYNPNGNVFPKDCYYLLLSYLLCLFSSSPVFPITSTLSPSPNPAFANDRGCLLKAPADIITDRMQNAITIFICKLNASLNTFLVSSATLGGRVDIIFELAASCKRCSEVRTLPKCEEV
jgi:hypothetical protein